MEDWILEVLENSCITTIETYCKKDNYHKRQAFVRYVEKTLLLWQTVF